MRLSTFWQKHNLPIKELYPALLHFLAFDFEKPITKQYLENCPKNATYDSHTTADSLISALNKFIKKQIQNSEMLQATSVAKKEMIGIFLSCYYEDDQQFVMEYLALLEVPSTKSAVLFFYQGFLSQTLMTHRTAGEGRAPSFVPLYHFHPLMNIQTFICNFACETTITYF